MATRKDAHASTQSGGDELVTRPVTECNELDDLLSGCYPSFGGGYLRRIWKLLDEAVGKGLPMTLSISGPVTVSGQHYVWLNPLLDTGWFAYISTTDAVCYHDGHRALKDASEMPFREVPIFGDDGSLRDEEIIRVTDIGFPEKVLLDQDRWVCHILRHPEFQKKMSGTEFRYLLGKHYAATEKERNVREGLLALCHRKALPIFVGAPGDGSVFLNSVLLWSLREALGDEHAFELDIHREVFESCAYHRWGIKDSDAGALGTLILGGGVPKNFNLQPEPALSQICGFTDITGYLYDIQLTTAPVTDGSLSSCPPAEAVTWGKVDKDHYQRTTESMQVDYSIVMPLLVKALLAKRDRLQALAAEIGEKALRERHPEAAGYLRDQDGYRLFDQRDALMERLLADIRADGERLRRDAAGVAGVTPS